MIYLRNILCKNGDFVLLCQFIRRYPSLIQKILNAIKLISPVMAHKATWDANPSCAAQLAVQPPNIGNALPGNVR